MNMRYIVYIGIGHVVHGCLDVLNSRESVIEVPASLGVRRKNESVGHDAERI